MVEGIDHLTDIVEFILKVGRNRLIGVSYCFVDCIELAPRNHVVELEGGIFEFVNLLGGPPCCLGQDTNKASLKEPATQPLAEFREGKFIPLQMLIGLRNEHCF